MAKPAKKASRPEVFDPSTPSDPVELKSTDEQWSELKLADGTVIRMRPVVAEVRRARNKFSETGEPVYFVKTALILNTTSPKRLHKKSRKRKKRKT